MTRSRTKKRSAGPPEPLTFFIDNNLASRALVTALRGLGRDVRAHQEVFRGDAPDPEWLAEVGRRGWVLLSRDLAIRRRWNELEALARAEVRAFFLPDTDMKGEDQARLFTRHIERIENLARDHRGPFIARVTESGVVIRDRAKDLLSRLAEEGRRERPE